MELDYNSFINGLLNNPSTTNDDRERIVTLLLKERDKGYVTEEQVMSMLEQYNENKQKSKGEGGAIKFKYISPKCLSQFLFDYNQDPILRYTCHCIDDEDAISDINKAASVDKYDFEKHLQLIKEHYKKLSEKSYVDYKIKSLILAYLTGKNYKGEDVKWSSQNIEDNWSSVQIRQWSKSNPNCVPNPGDGISSMHNDGYELQKCFRSNITGNRIRYFSDLVLYFKSLFHIKSDNSLKSIISYINRNDDYFKQCSIEFNENKFSTKIELFTNVDALISAYKKIIKICVEYSNGQHLEKPEIELSFYEDYETGGKLFCIHHINSVYGKSISDVLKRLGESQSQLIKNQINGLCDLYLRAEFENKECAEINLWDGKNRVSTPIDKMHGVQYIMKF